MAEDDDLIIEIEKYLSGELPLEDTFDFGPCKHLKVVLDDQAHTITCRACEKQLDPFWYLQMLAHDWKGRQYRDRHANESRAKLEEERRNIEAKGRAYEQPDSGVGHDAWNLFTQIFDREDSGGLRYMYRRGSEWYGVSGEIPQLRHYSLSYARSLLAGEKWQASD